jgi:hypothetical protein
MDAMGQYVAESMRAGVVVDTGGLAPASTGGRVRLSGGHVAVLDGPFSETKEVIGSYAVLECGSQEEAIEVLKRFLELIRTHWPAWEGECEVRRVFGPNE